MSIPQTSSPRQAWDEVEPDREWSALTTEAKYERILCAAGRLFAREGLDASMPAVAALAGAGIGSLYRQFPSKRELLAALVVRRLQQIAQAAVDATAQADHWRALTEMLYEMLERGAADDFLGEAWNLVENHEHVQIATARTYAAIDRLLELARAEGGLRSDATALDIRLVFMATRASRQVSPDAWQRALALMIDGLAAKRP